MVEEVDALLEQRPLAVQLFLSGLQLGDLGLQKLHLVHHLLRLTTRVLIPGAETRQRQSIGCEDQ